MGKIANEILEQIEQNGSCTIEQVIPIGGLKGSAFGKREMKEASKLLNKGVVKKQSSDSTVETVPVKRKGRKVPVKVHHHVVVLEKNKTT